MLNGIRLYCAVKTAFKYYIIVLEVIHYKILPLGVSILDLIQ